jgi:F0F1-type ATP synthase delta subunit
MSWLDKIGSTIFPLASDEKRAEARRTAEELARSNQWLEQILAHHKALEQCFEDALSATDVDSRRHAMRALARLNTGHSIAEEVTVYPALVEHNGMFGGKVQAALAYEEQQMTKIQQAMLEQLDPMSQEWRTKLEHIMSAVQQHVYEEEGSRFAELAKALSPGESARLSRRYAEEFERYCGGGISEEAQTPLQMAAQEVGKPGSGLPNG